MKLGKTYTCLAYFMVNGNTPLKNISLFIEKIKRIAGDIYSNYLNPKAKKGKASPKILVNYYVDKRNRSIKKK